MRLVDKVMQYYFYIDFIILVYRKSFLNASITRVARRLISLRWNYTSPSDQDSYLYLEYYCLSCAAVDFVRLCITDKNNTTIRNLMANQNYNISIRELFDGKFIENGSVTFQVKTMEDGKLYYKFIWCSCVRGGGGVN